MVNEAEEIWLRNVIGAGELSLLDGLLSLRGAGTSGLGPEETPWVQVRRLL
ncbi:hypothetical protein [Streptomyces fractus]|uniref:hypothetical protein n=1 Tax=Streptomyces fractus TaxID=641806 RepID=UPI003CEE6F6A